MPRRTAPSSKDKRERDRAKTLRKTQERLENASKAVTGACRALVRQVQEIIAQKNAGQESVDYSKLTDHEFKVQQMEQQVFINNILAVWKIVLTIVSGRNSSTRKCSLCCPNQAWRDAQAFLSKSLTGGCPIGPYIVTKDELPTPEDVNIVTKVNNEIRQDGNTSQMILKIDELIEEISKYVALHPGDIIATGTPAGVGAGMNPPQFLQPGDEVKVTIDNIGTLTNYIAKEE